MAPKFQTGQRLSYDGALCTVRYVGEVAGTSSEWLGVEWDDPSRGKHNGSHKGNRYFECKSKSPTAASFVRPTRPSDPPRSFVEALQAKYASEVTADRMPIQSGREIVISGKVAEEVGFDKIRRMLANLGQLKIVILDGMLVASASATGAAPEKSIQETCPRITELDLSRNLFNEFGTVVDVCRQLVDLKSLRVNGNRFQGLLEDERLRDAGTVFGGVKDLAMEETLMCWGEICHIAEHFPSIKTLFAGTNQLQSLSPVPPSSPLISSLTSLNLEYNDFTALSDLAGLTALESLRNLHLKGNNISSITPPDSPTILPPVFPPALHYVDISYNRVSSWAVVDALPSVFPGLTSFRFSHNPIYDEPSFDTAVPATADPGATTAKTTVTEEAYMITLARLPSLTSLNFSAVTAQDRTNAEMFYLSRIARQLSAVPAGSSAAAAVRAQHRRYAELCDDYGEPSVVRAAAAANPAFLEARLVGTTLYRGRKDADGRMVRDGGEGGVRVVQIPKSFDVYAVKGIAGRLFGLSPLRLRLVWETGEWDPVAGYDDDAEVGSSGDEGGEDEWEEKRKLGEGKGGRWVKREVPLKDSPRQFGFCVDGPEVTIRVEAV